MAASVRITKYVLVTESGNPLDMGDRRDDYKALAERTPGTHVERWTWDENPDGTHGEPLKEKC